MRDNAAVVLGMFETGLAVGRSLSRAGVRVTGLDSVRKVGFHSMHIDARICPHPAQEDEFIDFLLDIADQEIFRPVLFITSDEFLLPVSRNRKRLEGRYLLNLPSQDILECIADKYRQYTLALEAGIPVPKTFLPRSMEEVERLKSEIPYPAFIKGAEVTLWRSKMGVASKGFVVNNPDELMGRFRTIFERGANGLIQEIIPGPDTNHYKSSCYVSKSGEILLAFGLQKIRQQPVGFGFGCMVRSVEYPEMVELGKEFFRKIGYRGVGSSEFKLDPRDGKLKLIELNPRYWQQNGLPDRCGMNFPLTHYLDMIGEDPKPVLGYRAGVKWVNVYCDIESFREYRKRGLLSLTDWLGSYRGELMLSDLEWDDPLPGLREIWVENLCRRTGRFFRKRMGKKD
jgi:predicted ATP-grasp superfamily ATP-dependent carboligase